MCIFYEVTNNPKMPQQHVLQPNEDPENLYGPISDKWIISNQLAIGCGLVRSRFGHLLAEPEPLQTGSVWGKAEPPTRTSQTGFNRFRISSNLFEPPIKGEKKGRAIVIDINGLTSQYLPEKRNLDPLPTKPHFLLSNDHLGKLP